MIIDTITDLVIAITSGDWDGLVEIFDRSISRALVLGLSLGAIFIDYGLWLIQQGMNQGFKIWINAQYEALKAGMGILFGKFFLALGALQLIYGGLTSLEGLTLEFENIDVDLTIELETEWVYDEYWQEEVPECTYTEEVKHYFDLELDLDLITMSVVWLLTQVEVEFWTLYSLINIDYLIIRKERFKDDARNFIADNLGNILPDLMGIEASLDPINIDLEQFFPSDSIEELLNYFNMLNFLDPGELLDENLVQDFNDNLKNYIEENINLDFDFEGYDLPNLEIDEIESILLSLLPEWNDIEDIKISEIESLSCLDISDLFQFQDRNIVIENIDTFFTEKILFDISDAVFEFGVLIEPTILVEPKDYKVFMRYTLLCLQMIIVSDMLDSVEDDNAPSDTDDVWETPIDDIFLMLIDYVALNFALMGKENAETPYQNDLADFFIDDALDIFESLKWELSIEFITGFYSLITGEREIALKGEFISDIVGMVLDFKFFGEGVLFEIDDFFGKYGEFCVGEWMFLSICYDFFDALLPIGGFFLSEFPYLFAFSTVLIETAIFGFSLHIAFS